MSAVCLIDTSIFLEILNVPGKSNSHSETLEELGKKVDLGETMLLPMTTIIETGNHIAQNGNGNERRAAADRFVEQVKLAIEGKAPFTPMNFLEAAELSYWLDDFPNHAMRGTSLGDLLIIREFEKSKRKMRQRGVYIWSNDTHLQGYDSRN